MAQPAPKVSPFSNRKSRVQRIVAKRPKRDVLRPEEEFTSAREIEALEIMLWEHVMSYAPAQERILEALATVPDLEVPAEARALRRNPGAKAVSKAAKKLRAADNDHLFI